MVDIDFSYTILGSSSHSVSSLHNHALLNGLVDVYGRYIYIQGITLW